MTRVIEIRTYRLKPGAKAHFHQLVITQSLPLLQRFGTDVVAFGPSYSEEDGYFLIRAYGSTTDLAQQQEVFYARPEWIEGPRQAILDLIVEHISVVCAANESLIEALRPLGHVPWLSPPTP
jgi:NIPSNAP